MEIPHKIHYCWFGGKPLPKSAINCIQSWKKHFPEYEIIEWNEKNFDVNMIPFTAEAYRLKKYAFVSDFARLWILYNYGGVYFDTDVEVVKSMDDIISCGSYLGVEKNIDIMGQNVPGINPGLGFAAYKGHLILKEIIDEYNNTEFKREGEDNYGFITIVTMTTKVLLRHGYRGFINSEEIQYCGDFFIYPRSYFCPELVDNKWNVVNETRSIHHYAATWLPFFIRLKIAIVNLIPAKWYKYYKSI